MVVDVHGLDVARHFGMPRRDLRLAVALREVHLIDQVPGHDMWAVAPACDGVAVPLLDHFFRFCGAEEHRRAGDKAAVLHGIGVVSPFGVELVAAELAVTVEGDLEVDAALCGQVEHVVEAPAVVEAVAADIVIARVVLVRPLGTHPPATHPCADEAQLLFVEAVEVVVEIVGALLPVGMVAAVAHVYARGEKELTVLELEIAWVLLGDPYHAGLPVIGNGSERQLLAAVLAECIGKLSEALVGPRLPGCEADLPTGSADRDELLPALLGLCPTVVLIVEAGDSLARAVRQQEMPLHINHRRVKRVLIVAVSVESQLELLIDLQAVGICACLQRALARAGLAVLHRADGWLIAGQADIVKEYDAGPWLGGEEAEAKLARVVQHAVP